MNKLTGMALGAPVQETRRLAQAPLLASATFSPLNFEEAMSGIEAGEANLTQPQGAVEAGNEIGHSSGRGQPKGKPRKDSSELLPVDSTASFLPQAASLQYRSRAEEEAVQGEPLAGELPAKLTTVADDAPRSAQLLVTRHRAVPRDLNPTLSSEAPLPLTNELTGGGDPVSPESLAVPAPVVQRDSDSSPSPSVQVRYSIDSQVLSPLPQSGLQMLEPMVPSRSGHGGESPGLIGRQASAVQPSMVTPPIRVSNLQVEVRPEPAVKPSVPGPVLTPATSSFASTVQLTRGFGAEANQIIGKLEEPMKVSKPVNPITPLQWEGSQLASAIQSQGQPAKGSPGTGQRFNLSPMGIPKNSDGIPEAAAGSASAHARLLALNDVTRMELPGKPLDGGATAPVNAAFPPKEDIKKSVSEQMFDATAMHLMAAPQPLSSDGRLDSGQSTSVLDGQMLNQIADQARSAMEGGLQTASFQLDDSLGPLQVRIEVTGTQAAIHFISDVPGQRELLGGHVGDLAQRLQDHGLQLSGAYFSSAGGQADGFRDQRRQDEANQTKGARKVVDADRTTLSAPIPSNRNQMPRSAHTVDYFA